MSYWRSRSLASPAWKARALAAKSRPVRSGIRRSSIQLCVAAYAFTMLSVSSVDPSLTMTHLSGLIVW